MPNRIIRDGLVDSDKVNALSYHGECFYVRLMLCCDDAGRFDGRESVLRSRLFPTGTRRGDDPIRKGLKECAKIGLVIAYTVDEKPYLQIVKWRKCGQSKLSKFPAPGGNYEIHFISVGTKQGEKEFVDSSLNTNTNTKTLYEDEDGKTRPHTEGVASETLKKHKHGSQNNVLLTDKELEQLKETLGSKFNHWLQTFSDGIAMKSYGYKSHYLAILKWAKNEKTGGNKPPSKIHEGANAGRNYEEEYAGL